VKAVICFSGGMDSTTLASMYLRSGYELELISFPNSTSQVNALTGGQIDVASSIDPSLVRVVQAAGSGYKVYSYPTGS